MTPMAAVAGAVADEILAVMEPGDDVRKAYVNNGGDIAFHLAQGASLSVLGAAGQVLVRSEDVPRGIATSGWRGRSHSLGVADAVTVLGATAAEADAAATILANAVDLPGHPAIRREPASTLYPESDLGERLVTTDVGPLTAEERSAALDAGEAYGEALAARDLIVSAALFLGPDVRVVGAHGLLAKV